MTLIPLATRKSKISTGHLRLRILRNDSTLIYICMNTWYKDWIQQLWVLYLFTGIICFLMIPKKLLSMDLWFKWFALIMYQVFWNTPNDSLYFLLMPKIMARLVLGLRLPNRCNLLVFILTSFVISLKKTWTQIWW